MFRRLSIAILILVTPFTARAAEFRIRMPGGVWQTSSTPIATDPTAFTTFGENCGPAPFVLCDGGCACDPGASTALAVGNASAAANLGSLQAQSVCSTARSPGNYPHEFGTNIEGAVATFHADDLVLTDQTGHGLPTVPCKLRLVLFGNIDNFLADQGWSATCEVGATVNGRNQFGEMQVDLGGAWGTSGILLGLPGPGVIIPTIFTLDFGDMPVGTPLTIELSLEAGVGGGPPHNSSYAHSNFTWHFNGGPLKVGSQVTNSGGVFDLPPGYTADIPSLNVHDNTWVGETIAVESRTWGMVKGLYR